jgi:hypothetical protein
LEVWLCWETGWCGRANGFGGPEAPALRRAEAEGEGGGRTTPEPEEECSWDWPFRRWLGFVLERGEEFESAVPDSSSSSGILTFRTGRLPPIEPLPVFVRDGGWKPSGADDMDVLRAFRLFCAWTAGGDLSVRETAPTSTDCDRLFVVAVSLRDGSAFEVEDAQC